MDQVVCQFRVGGRVGGICQFRAISLTRIAAYIVEKCVRACGISHCQSKDGYSCKVESRRFYHRLYWALPLLLFSHEALAWGLYTHVYFSQLLIWATPLADPSLRRVLRRLPRYLMAGSCLPDVSLVSWRDNCATLTASHQWEQLGMLMRAARSDEDIALCCGYASHLLVDVVAHNHFVPTHEHVWLKTRMATHVASEWSMDHHVRDHLFARPGDLLSETAPFAASLLGRAFECEEQVAQRKLKQLSRLDTALRKSRIPAALYSVCAALDPKMKQRFDLYLRDTESWLPQITRVMQGEQPLQTAEVAPLLAHNAIAQRLNLFLETIEYEGCYRKATRQLLHATPSLPEALFEHVKT